MRIQAHVVSTAVLVLACIRAAATTTENQEISTTSAEEIAADDPDALPDLRFHVPFPVVNVQGLDLESLSTTPPDLRIKRTLVANNNAAACDANSENVPAYPSMQASDRLLSVDGIPISLQSFQEVIDMAVGTSVVLPLFKASSDKSSGDTGGGNILTGFARIEIMRPQSVEFQPTTPERVAQVQQWHEAVARKQQQQLDREQEERERKAALENDLLEKQAREKRDKDEKYRLEMTPHDRVHAKRIDGKEFRYEVVFVTKGPIGLNWDLLTTDRTIVSHVEPKLAAERAGVISPKDQLIELNDVDTSTMAPQDVVQVYIQSTPPRRMVFRSSATAAAAAKAAEALGVLPPAEKVQNWTIAFESPAILSGWQTRLHLATWSKEPDLELVNKTMVLAMATPMTGCQTLPEVAKDRQPMTVYLTYRGGCSFVDKAQFAHKSNAKALIVVNNLKGDGRFPAKMPDVSHVDLAVTMIGKMDGELVMAILEHDTNVRFHLHQEDPSQVPSNLPPKPAPRLTNEEMVLRRDTKKAARALTFWYVNTTTQATTALHAQAEFRVLPALFGHNITTMPYRIVVAYPQDTACHPQGLGVLGTRAVILVKRGGCSFGTKAKTVQAVGGAGMLMINSDESLLPLMSDPKETAELTIWAASIGLSNGTFLADIVTRNKNLPSLVKIAPHAIATATPSA